MAFRTLVAALSLVFVLPAAGAETTLCELKVGSKWFGRLYQAGDGSRHLSFAAAENVFGDLIVTGKRAGQKVVLPKGAKRCEPLAGAFTCDGFSLGSVDCIKASAGDIRFGKGPSQIKFSASGDPGACMDVARELQQRPTLLSVAACLVEEPKPLPKLAPEVQQRAETACTGAAATKTEWDALTVCIANSTLGTNQAIDECCKKMPRKPVQGPVDPAAGVGNAR